MIRLSNDHQFEYMVSSGALGFDGHGWFWERPLVKLGLVRPELFTVVLRTVTRKPRLYPVSNLSWIRPWTWVPASPWSCVRLLPGGAVNKVGLYNPGIDWWCEKIGPYLNYDKYPLVGSIFGDEQELMEMAEMLNQFNLVGLEVNYSCPNTNHDLPEALRVVQSIKAAVRISRHPVIAKLAVNQDCLAIANGLLGEVKAISLNSVPWKIAFPNGEVTPLRLLEQRIGGGGGGVSGQPAQKYNWATVEMLAQHQSIPVVAPSVMEFEDMDRVRQLGASAISFGAIHLPTKYQPWTLFTNPCQPTAFVKRERRSGT